MDGRRAPRTASVAIMGLETSAERPVPVRTVARMIGQWIGRLGRIWVEGQIAQLTRRPGGGVVFITLRDPVADVSLQVTCGPGVLDGAGIAVSEGQRVVLLARPEFYVPRGTLALNAEQIRPVGLGELLARIEQLRRVLAAEGLFDPARKKRLPFLPATVGLVCGRGSAAERDVVENARRRWPAVRFTVEEVAVQGPYAVTQVVDALRRLDRDPDVDVIVLARGGGSIEDLLPFSDEALLRAVAASRTPVVSAIGHEQDAPLLDLVADVRASTPTDAGKRVVPDVGEQSRLVGDLRSRARRAIDLRVRREAEWLEALRHRPILAYPERDIDRRAAEIRDHLNRARRFIQHALDRANSDVSHSLARVQALSPLATLRRGYAVVQHDQHIVRSPADAPAGASLTIRLAAGRLAAVSEGEVAP
jgi:exodeoxyribonuclease VII large subunit